MPKLLASCLAIVFVSMNGCGNTNKSEDKAPAAEGATDENKPSDKYNKKPSSANDEQKPISGQDKAATDAPGTSLASLKTITATVGDSVQKSGKAKVCPDEASYAADATKETGCFIVAKTSDGKGCTEVTTRYLSEKWQGECVELCKAVKVKTDAAAMQWLGCRYKGYEWLGILTRHF